MRDAQLNCHRTHIGCSKLMVKAQMIKQSLVSLLDDKFILLVFLLMLFHLTNSPTLPIWLMICVLSELLFLVLAVTCPKCGYGMAAYKTMQTRSADEPETILYACLGDNCRHTWRDQSSPHKNLYCVTYQGDFGILSSCLLFSCTSFYLSEPYDIQLSTKKILNIMFLRVISFFLMVYTCVLFSYFLRL